MGKTKAKQKKDREMAKTMLLAGKTIRETAAAVHLSIDTVQKCHREVENDKMDELLVQWDAFMARLIRPIRLAGEGGRHV